MNLPKWLLLLVVIGVFVGQGHQLVCKAGGHETDSPWASVATLSAPDEAGDDADGGADVGCAFHCQFNSFAVAAFASFALPGPMQLSVSRIEFQQDDPTSRSGSIDLPPQIA